MSSGSPSVFVVLGNPQVKQMFRSQGWNIAPNPTEADLIQFTGGADIDPKLYGAEPHKETHSDPKRDAVEIAIYNEYLGKKPFAGICRGGQLLWVLNGGKMNQHIRGHNSGPHPLISRASGNFICLATSVHHQSMKTTDKANMGNVLAYGNDKDRLGDYEVEVGLFHDTKSLCFQPHPEFAPAADRGKYPASCRDYYFRLLWNYLIPKG